MSDSLTRSAASGAGGVPIHLAGDLAARVRAAALQEAARRLQAREQAARLDAAGVTDDALDRDDLTAGAGPSRRSPSDFHPSQSQASILVDELEEEERHERLVQLLREESARNDAEWAISQRELARIKSRLAKGAPRYDSALHRRVWEQQVQIAQMEARASKLERTAHALDPESSLLHRDVAARGTLADTISQLEVALLDAEHDIQVAKDALERERQLRSDLSLVEEGMHIRERQLQRRSTQLTEEELIEELKKSVRAQEAELGKLLGALIKTSNYLFDDEEARMRGELRSLLDALMNRGWDTPADPYVNSERYSRTLCNFLVRAHIALEHPRDARRLRLVPFQKANRV